MQSANRRRSCPHRTIEAVEIGDLGQRFAHRPTGVDDLAAIERREADRSPSGLRRHYALGLSSKFGQFRALEMIGLCKSLQSSNGALQLRIDDGRSRTSSLEQPPLRLDAIIRDDA